MLGLYLASLALSATSAGASLLPDEIEGRPRSLWVSLRFWTLFGLGFGLVGAPLTLLAVGPLLTLGVALATGAVLGRASWPLFEESSGEITISGLCGLEGRVLVPVSAVSGKIVVQTLAHRVELPARSDAGRLEAGARVLVAFVEDGVARVIGLG